MKKNRKRATKNFEHDDFHREVGELVFWFSCMENIIYLLAKQLIGSKAVAKVVMENLHLEKAVDVVRKLARANHARSPHLEKFDRGLLAFKECAQERNALLHGVAFPELDADSGEEIIHIMSLRTMRQLKKGRTHIDDLRGKITKCSTDYFQAAIDMGLFKRRRRSSTAEQGVGPDGRSPAAPARRSTP